MNPQTVTAILQLASASLAFLRQLRQDESALAGVVEQARAEGREVDLGDVKAQLDRMHQDSAALDALIASKRA